MGKVKAVPQFSESISSFCKLMENAQRDYAWNYDEVNRMDRLTQDYLHKLELDGLDYKERAKVATQLAKCRQARRECKDTVEILEPLVQFLESDKGKNLLNLVREALGKTRKVEERKFRDFLATHHITNVAADSYTLDWSKKSITITAYAETKAQSRLIDDYIANSSLKFKRVISRS